jgi:hypothetical protein
MSPLSHNPSPLRGQGRQAKGDGEEVGASAGEKNAWAVHASILSEIADGPIVHGAAGDMFDRNSIKNTLIEAF